MFFLCILFYFLPVLGLPCPVGVSLQLPEPGLLCRCGARGPLLAVSSPVAGAVLGGLSWRCLLPLQVRCSAASRGGVFSCCRAQAVGMGRHWLRLSDSRAQVQQSWYTCLAVPQPVGTSQTRDQTHIACMTKWILKHWPTREAPMC